MNVMNVVMILPRTITAHSRQEKSICLCLQLHPYRLPVCRMHHFFHKVRIDVFHLRLNASLIPVDFAFITVKLSGSSFNMVSQISIVTIFSPV